MFLKYYICDLPTVYLIYCTGQGATITEEPSSPIGKRDKEGGELQSELVINLLMKISQSLEELKEQSKSNFSLIEGQLMKQNTILTQRNEILEQQRYIEEQRLEIEKRRFELESAKTSQSQETQEHMSS